MFIQSRVSKSLPLFCRLSLLLFSHTVLAIKGGKEIPKNWYQSLPPALRIQTDMTCGATALSSQVLVIAAHCVENFGDRYGNLNVISPETNQSENKRARVYKHPKYKKGFRENPNIEDSVNDIAVIVLSTGIGNERDFAVLPKASFRKSQFTFVSSGPDGKSDTNDNQFETFNLYQQTRTVADGSTVKGFISVPKDKESRICVGDSGSGYFSIEDKVWTLAAVQSVGTNMQNCGGQNSESYAVSILKHVDWISGFLPKPQIDTQQAVVKMDEVLK